MADLTPLGSIVSYAGIGIGLAQNISSVAYPTIDPNETIPTAQTLGQIQPVDLLNGQPAPRTDTFTCNVLVRAQDVVTDPIAAYQQVASGVRALQNLPTIGTLVVNLSTTGAGTTSCTARRKWTKIELGPKNARMYVYTLTFILLTPWV